MTDPLTPRERCVVAAVRREFEKKQRRYERRGADALAWFEKLPSDWPAIIELTMDEMRAAAEPPSPPQDGGSTHRPTGGEGHDQPPTPGEARRAAAPATPTPDQLHRLDVLFEQMRLLNHAEDTKDCLPCRAIAEARELVKTLLSAPERAPATERPIPRWIDYFGAEHAELMTKERDASFAAGVAAAAKVADEEARDLTGGNNRRAVARDIADQIRSLALSPAAAPDPLPWEPTHRHYKGGLYRKLFDARHSEALDDLVIYENAQGEKWARPAAMFNDPARFTPIARRAAEGATDA